MTIMYLVMVTAHWDTVATSPGVDDNGSGVAALLETARILTSRAEQTGAILNTVIFAALDKEEVGCEGAKALVRDFVVPVLVKQFGAAVQVILFFLQHFLQHFVNSVINR